MIIYVTLILALLLALAVYFKSKPAKHSVIALMGPLNSGKTSFLAELEGVNPLPTTVTSAAVNSVNFGSYEVVDCPGHPKLWPETLKLLDNPSLSGVLYVIDSSCSTKPETARFKQILEKCQSRRIKIAVAVNKTDLFASNSAATLRKELETELNTLIQNNKLQSSVEEDNDEVFSEFEVLNFDDLEVPVSVLEGSVKQHKTEQFQEFIEECGSAH